MSAGVPLSFEIGKQLVYSLSHVLSGCLVSPHSKQQAVFLQVSPSSSLLSASSFHSQRISSRPMSRTPLLPRGQLWVAPDCPSCLVCPRSIHGRDFHGWENLLRFQALRLPCITSRRFRNAWGWNRSIPVFPHRCPWPPTPSAPPCSPSLLSCPTALSFFSKTLCGDTQLFFVVCSANGPWSFSYSSSIEMKSSGKKLYSPFCTLSSEFKKSFFSLHSSYNSSKQE